MNPQTKILACIHVVLGGAGLAVVFVMLTQMAAGFDSGNLKTYQFIGFVLLVISVAYLIPAVAGGIGLLRHKRWAWPVTIALSVLLLPLIPFGTVLGGYGLWVLLARDRQPERTEGTSTLAVQIPAWLSRNAALLLVMAGVGAGFVAMLQAGFWLNNETAPVEITSSFPLAVATLVVIAGLIASGNWPKHAGVQQPFFQSFVRMGRPLQRGSSAAFEKAERERLAALAADPVLRKYVALIKAGENWSDARIAYAENAGRVATCMHLQPVERAMRDTGIEVRLQAGAEVMAACRINRAALESVFGAPTSALYGEWHDTDHDRQGSYVASLCCRPCRSNIFVIHPQEAQPQVPWFPPRA